MPVIAARAAALVVVDTQEPSEEPQHDATTGLARTLCWCCQHVPIFATGGSLASSGGPHPITQAHSSVVTDSAVAVAGSERYERMADDCGDGRSAKSPSR